MENKPKRKAWSIPPELKQKVLDLRAQKMKLPQIAIETGLSLVAINNIVYYALRRINSKLYYQKNRDKLVKDMREYYRKKVEIKKLKNE